MFGLQVQGDITININFFITENSKHLLSYVQQKNFNI